MNMSLLELYESMGWFAKGIVFTLLGMSAFSFTVLIQKWWGMRKAQAETRKFAPEFSQFLEEDNLVEAINLAEGYKKSHVARVLGGALAEIRPLIQDGSVTVSDINTSERAVEREMLMTIVDLKRGLGVLATVGATAPFVGLLGTTMGYRELLHGYGDVRCGWYLRHRRRCGRSAHHHRHRNRRRHSRGVGVQLLPDEDR